MIWWGRRNRLTLWRLDANLLEALGLLHGPHDGLDELLNLLVQPTDVAVLLSRLLVNLHGLDSAIVLCRESVEDQVRVLVDADQVAGLEGFGVDEADEGQEDGLSRRRLDHGRLADPCGIEVDVGALLQRLGRGIEV